jgi:hypothetical protein
MGIEKNVGWLGVAVDFSWLNNYSWLYTMAGVGQVLYQFPSIISHASARLGNSTRWSNKNVPA